jgi:anti-sigma B factor antagonist
MRRAGKRDRRTIFLAGRGGVSENHRQGIPFFMSAEPAVVALDGEIDLHQSAQVLARLDPLIAARCPSIRVDLSGVTYMDSSGLATMIDAMQRTQSYGGEFALAGIRPNVMKVFQIARLDQVFRILA